MRKARQVGLSFNDINNGSFTMSEPTRNRPNGKSAYEGMSSFMGTNGAFMEALAQASQNYVQRVAALNEEILGFAATRMQKNSEASEQIMKCKDLSDALRVQQEWARSMTEQYMQEASRIMEMTTKAALAGFNVTPESKEDPLKKAS
jgi:hypothetical protein